MDECYISNVTKELSDSNCKYYWFNVLIDNEYKWSFIYDSIDKKVYSWRIKFNKEQYLPEGSVDWYTANKTLDYLDCKNTIDIFVMDIYAPNPNMPTLADRIEFMVWWESNKKENCKILDKMIVDAML